MDNSDSTMAQELAWAACVFERQRTDHMPESVTAVL
jgi:hypothetical protein